MSDNNPPYRLVLSSSSEDSNSSLSEDECHTITSNAYIECNASPGSSDTSDPGEPASDKELTYGCMAFWLWVFSTDESNPLIIKNLPQFSDEVADLSLIAASQYNGELASLPQPVAAFVSHIRRCKDVIFGTQREFDTKDYTILCDLLADELDNINDTWSEESCYVLANFSYNYRVSFNGVLCGTVRGPERITRYFVSWIHLRLGLFSSLRVRNLKRKWLTRGFKVYRFTPIPYVTVLRIFLRDSKTNRRAMIHATRQPD